MHPIDMNRLKTKESDKRNQVSVVELKLLGINQSMRTQHLF